MPDEYMYASSVDLQRSIRRLQRDAVLKDAYIEYLRELLMATERKAKNIEWEKRSTINEITAEWGATHANLTDLQCRANFLEAEARASIAQRSELQQMLLSLQRTVIGTPGASYDEGSGGERGFKHGGGGLEDQREKCDGCLLPALCLISERRGGMSVPAAETPTTNSIPNGADGSEGEQHEYVYKAKTIAFADLMALMETVHVDVIGTICDLRERLQQLKDVQKASMHKQLPSKRR